MKVLGFMMGSMGFWDYEKNTNAIGAGVPNMGVAAVAAFMSVYAELFAVFDRGHRSIWG
jgi:hypothetical protein